MINRHSFLSICTFTLLILAAMILATRLATLLHEAIGHALVAVFFGGKLTSLQVSLFGGGEVFYNFLEPIRVLPRFCVAEGGILLNFILGGIVWLFAGKFKRYPVFSVFISIFILVNILGALAYLVLGIYYHHGDPVMWMEYPLTAGNWWIPFLLIAPLVSFMAVGTYVRLQESFFPANSFTARIGVAIVTLGLATLIYACFFWVTHDHLAAIEAPDVAWLVSVQKVKDDRSDQYLRQFMLKDKSLSEEEARQKVKGIPIEVNEEEVPRQFPMIPVLVLLYLAGGVGALKTIDSEGLPRQQISTGSLIWMVGLAAVVLLLLWGTGGWIYR